MANEIWKTLAAGNRKNVAAEVWKTAYLADFRVWLENCGCWSAEDCAGCWSPEDCSGWSPDDCRCWNPEDIGR